MSTNEILRYLAISGAGGPVFNATGKEIAFVYNETGNMQVYKSDVVKNRAIWPKQLTFEDDRSTNPRFLHDGSIIFMRDKGGDENFQIGHLKNSELSWITNEGKAKHGISWTTKKNLYYSANILDKSCFGHYKVSIESIFDPAELIYQPSEGYFSLNLVNEEEDKFVFSKIYGLVHSDLFYLHEGKITNLTENLTTKRPNLWRAVRWLDKNTLLTITDYDSEYSKFGVLNLDGEFHRLEEFKDFQYNVDKFTFSGKDDFTYYSMNVDGYSKLFRGKFTKSQCTSIEEIKLPQSGAIIAGDYRTSTKAMSLSSDLTKLAICLSSPILPSNIFIIDLEANFSSWQVTKATLAGVSENDLVDCTLSSFKSFDELTVPYFIHKPKNKKPISGFPAIFIIHGGPEAQSKPVFSPIVQFFLKNNYAVVIPNIRGSTGYTRTYADLDNVEKRLDSIKDIARLTRYLRVTDTDIDSNRLVVFGGSYGGFAVLSSLVEHPDIWMAGIDIVGIANFVTFLEKTAVWRRKIREAEYGSLDKDLEVLRKISPIHKVDKIQCPLFIIQGDNDERVPLHESIQMYEKLKGRGLPVKLLRFPDEGHGIVKLKNKITAYTQIIEWLNNIQSTITD